jgi:integrase
LRRSPIRRRSRINRLFWTFGGVSIGPPRMVGRIWPTNSGGNSPRPRFSRTALPAVPIESDEQQERISDQYITSPDLEERLRGLEDLGVKGLRNLTPIVLDKIFGDRRIWDDRLRQARRPVVSEEKSIKTLAGRWLDKEQARGTNGQLTPRALGNIRASLGHFIEFLGDDKAADYITEEVLERHYLHLLGLVNSGTISPSNAKGRYNVARTFVRWLARSRLLEKSPLNLADPAKFGIAPPVIVTMTTAEILSLIGAATGQSRLHILLMLNCGFTPSDISTLRDDEIDWDRGRIRRKRSKTRAVKSVPVVDYPLWSRTFELLKEYRSGSEVVLLTKSGRPWIRESIGSDGKIRSSNLVKPNLDYLLFKTKINKPPKALRKTGATLLESHEIHSRFVGLYLGHAPGTIAERYYAAADVAGFDKAVKWLEIRLGLVEP